MAATCDAASRFVISGTDLAPSQQRGRDIRRAPRAASPGGETSLTGGLPCCANDRCWPVLPWPCCWPLGARRPTVQGPRPAATATATEFPTATTGGRLTTTCAVPTH